MKFCGFCFGEVSLPLGTWDGLRFFLLWHSLGHPLIIKGIVKSPLFVSFRIGSKHSFMFHFLNKSLQIELCIQMP